MKGFDECPECWGFGFDEDGRNCWMCGATGLVCSTCGYPERDCDCEDE